ncbi:hypothetical protein H4582DRAFT_2087530 [Lactarius indigo]|nr:hypothetical protein H4582DRAFT_2087530 [Lactarius indigo]
MASLPPTTTISSASPSPSPLINAFRTLADCLQAPEFAQVPHPMFASLIHDIIFGILPMPDHSTPITELLGISDWGPPSVNPMPVDPPSPTQPFADLLCTVETVVSKVDALARRVDQLAAPAASPPKPSALPKQATPPHAPKPSTQSPPKPTFASHTAAPARPSLVISQRLTDSQGMAHNDQRWLM